MKALIVLGMHRSGTSVVSQWLHKSGLSMGDVLLDGDLGNVEGHYEDLDFFNLHIDILNSNRLPTGGVLNEFDQSFDYRGFSNINITDYYLQKCKSIITLKSSLRVQFGWKDPRTCLFLDMYENYIPDAYYIILFRHYNEVVFSMIKRHEKYINKRFGAYKLGNIRFLRKKLKSINSLNKTYNTHLEAWIKYNEEILKLIDKKREKTIIINHKKLQNNSLIHLYDQLSDWSFKIDYVDFTKIYNQKYETKNILRYPYNKDLEKKAKQIQSQLDALSINIENRTH